MNFFELKENLNKLRAGISGIQLAKWHEIGSSLIIFGLVLCKESNFGTTNIEQKKVVDYNFVIMI